MTRSITKEPSEFLLELGRSLDRSRKTGDTLWIYEKGIEDVPALVSLASEFTHAPESLKFRALVEDWSMAQIREEVAAVSNPC